MHWYENLNSEEMVRVAELLDLTEQEFKSDAVAEGNGPYGDMRECYAMHLLNIIFLLTNENMPAVKIEDLPTEVKAWHDKATMYEAEEYER